ncbi:hypothetical protein BGM19_35520 [Streptomyces agglomeratus]|nr:hypothetical protein BGM19_35520 [Streptomyces agglomeratus]
MVDFHLVEASACLASSRKKPGDQLLAFDVDRGQLTVGDDRLLVLSQRDPAEPSDQWFPAGAFDAGLEALLPGRAQVDRPTGLDIDQDGSVMPSLTGGVLVDIDHPRGWQLPFWQFVDKSQDRAPADADAERLGHAGSGSASQG